MKCVAVAQHTWEGLHGLEERRGFEGHKSLKEKDYKDSKGKDDSRLRYSQTDSRRDRKDRYHLGHCHKDDHNKEKRRSTTKKEVICFKCNKPGHYATSFPNLKGLDKKPKVQSAQRDHSQASSRSSSRSSSPSSSQSSSEAPKTPIDSDSSDSLN